MTVDSLDTNTFSYKCIPDYLAIKHFTVYPRELFKQSNCNRSLQNELVNTTGCYKLHSPQVKLNQCMARPDAGNYYNKSLFMRIDEQTVICQREG